MHLKCLFSMEEVLMDLTKASSGSHVNDNCAIFAYINYSRFDSVMTSGGKHSTRLGD